MKSGRAVESGGAGEEENRCEARGNVVVVVEAATERRRRRDDASRRPSSVDARRKASPIAHTSLIALNHAYIVPAPPSAVLASCAHVRSSTTYFRSRNAATMEVSSRRTTRYT